MKKIALVFAAFVLFPANAVAARPHLTLTAAETAVAEAVAEEAKNNNETLSEGGLPITNISDRECDIETAYRALCDVTLTYANSETEEVTFQVVSTRHGPIVSYV